MKYLIGTIATVVAISLSMGLTACAKTPTDQQIAQDYFRGQLLFQQQKYTEAYPLLLESAQQNNANAIYAIGYMLYNGLGVKRDQTKALLWLHKAAKVGNIRAIEALQRLDAAG